MGVDVAARVEVEVDVPVPVAVEVGVPVLVEDGKMCLTAGYGEGGMMIQVRENNGVFAAKVLLAP